MKTANEMNAIATRVQEEKQASAKNRAIAVLENRIAPRVEYAAEQGEVCLSYIVNADINTNFIIDKLVELGYTANCCGNTITVCW